jgi:homoserine dehydrogenase
MHTHRFILTGLGNIGRNFLAIVQEREAMLRERYGLALQAVGLADSSGALYAPDGFDLAEVVALKQAGRGIASLATAERPLLTARELVERADAEFLLEATPTNLTDGQPGLDLVRIALRRGLHAVLASKGPLVLAYAELQALAARSSLAFGGAVCGELPTVNVGRRDLAGGEIRRVEACLNGTTQVILGLMARGQTYDAGLAEAQRIGIAEPDPSLDVDGWDSANKLVIIANAVLGQPTTLADVAVTGIRTISAAEARAAADAGGRLSLVASADRRPDGTYALSVRPTALAASHPLARLNMDEMGIVYHTDLYGQTTVTSAGPGPSGASAAMLRDILAIVGRGGGG